MRRALLVTVLAVLASPGGAAAAPKDVRAARAGLADAVAKGRLTPAEASRYRTVVGRAHALSRRLPAPRARVLEAVLGQVAGQARRYTRPRALTLFSMLEVNARHLASRPPLAVGRDVEDPDGVVYRAFAGRGLQFHPLANAARLNGHVSAGRAAKAEALARALLARGVPRHGGHVWEYWFPFGSVRAPWASGMAQAVLAQALARAAATLAAPELAAGARRAARTVPRLSMQLPEGPWVRLYEGLGLVVLNAQLQAAVSLAEYARLVDDGRAAGLARRMRAAASALLPRFDTGHWSLYSRRVESTLAYQRYVVTLLRRLGRETGEPHWARTADRFTAYEQQPPQVAAGRAVPVLFPVPQDGHRDVAEIRVRVSKISDVTLFVGGRWRASARARRGWNSIRWRVPATLAPGVHEARVSVRGLAGNVTEIPLPAISVERDRRPPRLSAALGRTHLHWRAKDAGSDRLRLRLRLRGGGSSETVDLGRRALSGSWRLRLPSGRWWGVLEAADASGNRARVPLGRVA